MSDKVRTFCNRVQVKLTTLDSRINSLSLNSGPTCHFLQEKLDESRARGEAQQHVIDHAGIRLEQWCDDKRLETRHTIEQWRQNGETRKFSERAQRAEDHAGYAMQLAEAGIDAAERMILEAISARLDAESVRGDDDVTSEFHQPSPWERTERTIRLLKSSDIIREEQVVVERVLDLLELACARIRHGDGPPLGFKRWSLGFFFQFANRCHHSQETSAWSPAVQFRGVSSDGGPVGVMLAHHKRGRAQIHLMQHAINTHDHLGWSLLSGEYALLLRRQFQHENSVLLQMTEVCGTDEDHADLAETFRSVDRAQRGHELSRQFDAQIEHWEERFQTPIHPKHSWTVSTRGTATEPALVGSPAAMKSFHPIGQHSLAIRDCETDTTTWKSLMFERQKLPEGTSNLGREAPRKSK